MKEYLQIKPRVWTDEKLYSPEYLKEEKERAERLKGKKYRLIEIKDE